MRVLVVGEGPVIAAACRYLHEQQGHAVIAVPDAGAALVRAQHETFPLILIGRTLPEMDGPALCRAMRATPMGESSVIVLTAATDHPDELTAVLDAGASDYVLEHADASHLTLRLRVAERQALEVQRRQDAETQLAMLAQTQREISASHHDLGPILALVAERARAITGASGSVVALVEASEIVYAEAGGSMEARRGVRMPWAGTPAGRCLHSGEVVRCEAREQDPGLAGAMLLAPLRRGHEMVGVIAVVAPAPSAFTGRDEQFARILGGLLATSMDQLFTLTAHMNLLKEYEVILEAMDQSEQRARMLIEKSPVGTCIVDEAGAIEVINAAYAALFGYAPEEMIGAPCTLVLPQEQHESFLASLRARLADEQDTLAEYEVIGKGGRRITVWATGITLPGIDGRPRRASFVMDITERKRNEQHLAELAHFDRLTGLPNRTLFTRRLDDALVETRRTGRMLALLFVDLDGFKATNDTHGHGIGDLLLREVAARLAGCVRETDTVARLAGDEFVVILSGLKAREQAARVAAKIVRVLARPYHLADHRISVSASIGVSAYPRDGLDSATLLNRADAAMYRAKSAGKNNYLLADAPPLSTSISMTP